MSTVKEIKPAKKFIKQQITSGFVFTGIGVVGLFIGVGHLLGLGILVLVIAFSHKDRTIVKLFEDNMELKFGPLISTKYIKYSDVENVEKISERKILVHYKNNGKVKKMRLPVGMFEQDDLSELLNILENKTAA